MTERIQKLISAAGLMSRRAAEDLIREGRVTVEGQLARLGDKADPRTMTVAVDGVPLPISPDLVTYLLYKPLGVISSSSDPEGRPVVVDLVPREPRVVPVGRLDYDTEGLLLLSNDGTLVNVVTHPRYGIHKTYVADVEGQPGAAVLRQLRNGVELEDGLARVERVRVTGRSSSGALIELVLGEGRNREVRRLLEAVGHPVVRLVRTAIGPIHDRSLRKGKWRLLTNAEVHSLYRAAGLEEKTTRSLKP